ncbi:MAG: RIP metalloprotease RseP [Bdellovibrionales bacterium]|nr:RIP metalloprotease RseP [Bdellovibrionales bacterium]
MEHFFNFLSFFQKAFFILGPFIILLGILIFIHELGHFLVARFFKVKVEIFSLGFGPKILKYKKGDTLYCLSLVPLGGYVKMFGDNPLEEVPERERHQGFLYKKVYQKWLIAFAGPLFNFLFTLLAFFSLSLLGRPNLPAKLGDISENSLAFQKGFRSGDLILSVNQEKIFDYEELNKILQEKVGETLAFEVKNEKGLIKNITAKVQKQTLSDPIFLEQDIGFIEGFTILSQGLRLGVSSNSLAFQKGFRTFDVILEVGGVPLKYWRELKLLSPAKNYELKIERNSKVQTLFIELDEELSLLDLGLESSLLYIEKVGPKTPARKAGLKRGDRLISIQGEGLKTWTQVLSFVENSQGENLILEYQRGKQIKTISIAPKKIFVEGNLKSKYMLGIASAWYNVYPEKILRKYSIFQALIYSGTETWKWLTVTSVGLVRLITGDLSVRTMAGPITIGRIAHSSFSEGFYSFLFMMALISLNLGFLNLLPIPVLDGGHILFFTIEAVLGRPLNLKKLILAQQLGLIFLLSFMVFVLFNDIYNWFSAW